MTDVLYEKVGPKVYIEIRDIHIIPISALGLSNEEYEQLVTECDYFTNEPVDHSLIAPRQLLEELEDRQMGSGTAADIVMKLAELFDDPDDRNHVFIDVGN